MKVFVPRILTGFLTCMIVTQTIYAQNDPPVTQLPDGTFVPAPVASPPVISSAPGTASVQNYFGYTDVDRTFEPLMRVDSRGGSLMGQQGFTAAEIFAPYWADSDSMIFADLRGFATYRPAGGANVGFGWRGYFDDLDRIIGVNAWYDFDAGHVDQYHQFGVGFESLGRYLDYRVNGYIPFAGTSNLINHAIITGGDPKFVNHFIYLDRYYRQETAMKGFDAEMGGPVPFLGKYGLSAYAGMYLFTGLNTGNITGVTGRLTGQVNEDLTVGAQFSHDNFFDNNVQIQVSWTIPDGGSSRWLRSPTVRDRMTSQVLRNYRILAKEETVVVSEKAINPLDGLPYFVAHINPNGAAGTGDGTVENPWSQISQFDTLGLADKSAYDIIYVSPNLDNSTFASATNHLDTGVTLLSNQRLLSTSVEHQFEVIAAQADVTGETMFTLPGFVADQPLPVLSNSGGGDVVTFTTGATNIEVAGFEIVGSATGSGIAGIDNTKINVNRNEIRNGVHGIDLTNLSGTGYDPETGTTVFTRVGTGSSFDQNEIHDNLGDGLRVVNNPGTAALEIQVTSNELYFNGNDGAHIEANGTEIRGLIDGNTTQVAVGDTTGGGNGRHGIFLSVDNGLLEFFDATVNHGISNNTFNFNEGDGLHIESTGASDVAMRIVNNTFGTAGNALSANDGYGVFFSANGGTAIMQIGGTEDDGNTFFANGLGGVLYDLSGDNITQTEIANNTFTSPVLGLDFRIVGDTLGQPFSITNTSDTGFDILSFQLDLTASDVVWDTEEPGVSLPFAPLNGTGATTGLLTINGNPFPNTLPSGGLPDGQPLLDLTFNSFNADETFTWEADVDFNGFPGTTVIGSDLIGSQIDVNFTGGQTLSGTLQALGTNGSQFVASSGALVPADAIRINTSDTAQLINSNISQNTITGSSGRGIFVNANNNSVVDNLVIDGNVLTRNAGGIRLENADNAIIDAILINNIVTESTGNGLELVAASNNANSMTINMADNEFTDNTGDGANLLASGSGIVVLESNRDTFSDNTESGFSAQSADTSQVFITLNNVTATGNSLNGVEFTSTAFSIMDVIVASPTDPLFTGTGANISNNGTNGIAATSRQNSQMFITAFGNNTLVTGNQEDGIHLERFDASLFIADFSNMLISGNQDDGMQFDTSGGAPSDPNQPFSGTANQLILTNIQLNDNGSINAENGGNGLELNTYADSVLIVDALSSTFNGNVDDGIRGFSGDNSSIGQFGNRSVFDNVQILDNNASGVHLMSAGNNTQKANMFIEFNSNSGNTNISDNTRNGIQVSIPYGNADILVQGDTVGPANFATRIQNNGGDGIQFNVADIAAEDDGDDTAVDPDRQADLDMLAFQFRNDLLNNQTPLDAFQATGTLTVNNVIIGDQNPNDAVADGNGGDGINVYNANSDLYRTSALQAGLTVNPDYNPRKSGQVNLNVVNNSIVQGNGQDGITVNSQGIHTYTFFDFAPQGNLVNATITDSLIANNAGNGINFDFDGMHGRTDITSLFFGTINRINQNEILIDNNVIQNNGGSGTRIETNTGSMLRYDYTLTAGAFVVSYPSDFWGIHFADPAVSPGDGVVFNPFAIGAEGWTFYQAGFTPTVLLSNYLNMLTDNNTNLRFFRNTVQFNGVAENGTAAGLNIRLSTNSFLSADVGGAAGSGLGNFFSGNIGADVKTRSYTATDANGVPIQPGPSTPGDDTAAPPTNDHMFLDDTAQLDLRFNNNTGRTFDAVYGNNAPLFSPLTEAGYDNDDPGKGGSFFRPTQVYQVDDGLSLNANNNWTQDLPSILNGNGNFFLRTVADPLFPNPDFPENWNSDNGDPFLP